MADTTELSKRLTALNTELDRIIGFGCPDLESEILAEGPGYKLGRYEKKYLALLAKIRSEIQEIRHRLREVENEGAAGF